MSGHVATPSSPPGVHPRSLLFACSAALSLVLASTAAVPEASGQVRVMPLGDSITESALPLPSYRKWLWQDLLADGLCVDFVGGQTGVYGGGIPGDDFDLQHEGHSGWRADEIAGNILGWAGAAQPDIVLLLAGANDVIQGDGAANAVFDLELIIQGLRTVNPNVTVLLGQYYHVHSDDPTLAPLLLEFVQLRKEVALLAAATTTPASPVILVDLAPGFDARFDTKDGAHPNAVGEQKLADTWRATLAPRLTPTPASASSYGAGVPGALGVPALTGAAPVLGANLTLTVGNPSGGPTTGVLFFGFAPRSLPGSWGGDLLVEIAGQVALPFTSAGDLALPVTLPADGAFCGVHVFLQAFVADAGAAKGIATSPGLEWVLGTEP